MWLPWQPAVVIAVPLAVAGVSARRAKRPVVIAAGEFAREASIVLLLYGIWMLAGKLSVMQVTGALDRGRWVWHLERLVRLPSEVQLQRTVLPYPWLVRASNTYYALVHVPVLIAFLVWLFVRHRDRYPEVRTVLAIATGAALAVQLIPLAPPRMFPSLGFVDTGIVYHQSVYQAIGRGEAGQLAAMPSVHVAWAVLIGIAVFRIGRGPGRWVGPGHALTTVFVVVVTANHWWLDGIVAVMLLAVAWAVQHSTRAASRAVRRRVAVQRADVSPGLPAVTVSFGAPPEEVPAAVRPIGRQGSDSGSLALADRLRELGAQDSGSSR